MQRHGAIRDLISHFYEVPGLTIAVVHNHKLDWVKAYGVADLASGTPTEVATIFSAGSISKLANSVLPMRMPLAHTAGTTQSAFFGYQPSQKLPTTGETLSGAPPSENRPVVVNSAEGKAFRYAGGGTLISQLAATDVTGREDSELIRQKVFVPVGMTSSTMQQPLPANLVARASWAYSDTSWFTGVPYVYPQSSAAGLYSTAQDLALLLIEIQNAYHVGKSQVLTQESAKEMLKPEISVSDGTCLEHTGLGVFLLELKTNRQCDAGRYFGHTGVNAGFVADALGGVDGGNGVVVMANKDGAAMELLKEIRRSVARTYNWQEFLPPQVELMAVGMESLDRLVGLPPAF